MQKFKTSLNGYNKEEVNHFVFEVTQEYEGMLNNLKSRDAEIASLKARLQEYQNMESTLNKALLVAENAGNQIRKVARDESKAILDDAKRNASRIVNDALLKAEKMEADGTFEVFS
ncbi:DivIVA domain-containing protein [Paraprevotella clara]|uniref:DivIVA domain-containing protein n=1 Tax=Paraprevotella clara TaxID=454154 RepID=UPI00241BFE2A|nr:DivIVA domain-containing protein [Paraprevotella clara]